jgi:hypothetical protein
LKDVSVNGNMILTEFYSRANRFLAVSKEFDKNQCESYYHILQSCPAENDTNDTTILSLKRFEHHLKNFLQQLFCLVDESLFLINGAQRHEYLKETNDEFVCHHKRETFGSSTSSNSKDMTLPALSYCCIDGIRYLLAHNEKYKECFQLNEVIILIHVEQSTS